MIRKYENKDLEQLLESWYKSAKIAYTFFSEEYFTQERKNIEEIYLPNTETFVYENNGSVVGFIAMIDDEIGGLFVHPDFQGLKIGKQLVDFCFASRNGLIVEVFENNKIGKSFYDKYGFKEYDRYLYKDTNEIMIKMKI